MMFRWLAGLFLLLLVLQTTAKAEWLNDRAMIQCPEKFWVYDGEERIERDVKENFFKGELVSHLMS